jgi:hypothetical protein
MAKNYTNIKRGLTHREIPVENEITELGELPSEAGEEYF